MKNDFLGGSDVPQPLSNDLKIIPFQGWCGMHSINRSGQNLVSIKTVLVECK